MKRKKNNLFNFTLGPDKKSHCLKRTVTSCRPLSFPKITKLSDTDLSSSFFLSLSSVESKSFAEQNRL